MARKLASLLPSGKWKDLGELLRARGIRLSGARLLILEMLAREQAHYRAEELWETVNREYPAASRPTVYNTLHALCRAGLVREVLGQDGTRYYELDRGPHHHFVCEVCGAMVDVAPDVEAMAELARWSIAQMPGCVVRDVEVTLRGVCGRKACAEKAFRAGKASKEEFMEAE